MGVTWRVCGCDMEGVCVRDGGCVCVEREMCCEELANMM